MNRLLHILCPDSRAGAPPEEARQRLLLAALRLFSEHGFAKTSIREIASAAQVNTAAISYYFGDKSGLYKAAFTEPMGSPSDDIALMTAPGVDLQQALTGLYAGFVEPLKQGELARQCMRLHFREMIEPTGLWAQEIDNGIRPFHLALVGLLSDHFGLAEPDDDVQRLAFSIVGMGVHMFVGRDVVEAVAPHLTASPEAIDLFASRLVGFAMAMVASEAQRRSAEAGTARPAAVDGMLKPVAVAGTPQPAAAASKTRPVLT